jgi:hypothetical protein
VKKRILRDCLRIALSKNKSHPEWGNYHHFSFIVQGGKILEVGFNRSGSAVEGFGYGSEYPQKIHAENDVYRKARGILDFGKPFDVINIRLNKRGEVRISKPCECCLNFLSAVGCRNVYFSTEVGFARMT